MADERPALTWGPMIATIASVVTIVLGLNEMGIIRLFPSSGTTTQAPPTAATPSTPTSSKTAQAAWNQTIAAAERCDALRSFIRRFPGDSHATQAQALLATRKMVDTSQWGPFRMPLVVTGSSNLGHSASETVACESAQASAIRNAESGCDLYRGDDRKYRNITVSLPDLPCDCRDYAIRVDGLNADSVSPIWRCTVRATYHCRGESQDRTQRESCGD